MTPIDSVVPRPIMGKRSVQVVPNRSSGSDKHIVIRQEVHWIGCHFLDTNVERAFQLYYRRTKQTGLTVYMLLMIALNVAMTASATLDALGDTSSHFAQLVEPSTSTQTPSQRIHWISDTIIAILLAVFSVVALLLITVIMKVRLSELVWTQLGIDPVQFLLVIFNQLITVPILLATIGCAELELSYLRDFNAASQSSSNRQVLVSLGVPFIDTLYFVLFVTLSLSSCVLRMQFSYFLVIAVEFAVFVTAVSARYFPHVSDHWSWFIVFLILLVMVARGVWDGELSCRLEFLASCKLMNENRRLSNQNIVMQEELSGKLNYQLHYEMGDILRLLCQIKMKMSPAEKKDIDKIITALITNEDLFEVSFDPATAEHEEEVQGWLHMMAFKEAPPAQDATSSRRLSDRMISNFKKQTHTVLRTAQSRKLSQSITTEVKAVEAINKFFTKDIAEERDELSRWLFDTLCNDFAIDLFYIDERCSAPLQAILITCVEINDFVGRLGLDMKKLVAFAGAVDNHYFKRNPYHNCLHAGAVVADMHFYLRRLKLNIDDTTFFVGLVAAASHDISHPGVSNGFLISTRSKLAITYSDDSVLERMHIAELYRILSHEKFDIFAHFDATVRSDIRRLLIQMVLATDLSRHFQHITKLKSRKFAVTDDTRGVDLSLVMETLLMLSDLGHTAKPFAYHQIWANRIAEEFFRQGEAEERHNLPVSPLCDRRQANLPKSQVTFLTLLATPLFETAGEAFTIEEYDLVMTHLQGNIRTWQSMIPRSDSTDGAASSRSGRPVMRHDGALSGVHNGSSSSERRRREAKD
ncbi:hypothetical protein PINS_up002151 [Pythium insidiosum]|nr:hypothetical protein PINS_up002151 [Pythium insidiosum]